MTFEWSKYQKEIFNEVEKGTGNIVVEALAGSSKTTVLIECTNHIPQGSKTLLCAFNKRIKEELDTKISNPDVKCLTLHSLGFSAIRKTNPNVQVDSKKMDDVINSLRFKITDADYSKVMTNLKKTCSLAKSTLVDTPSKIKNIIELYDVDYTPYSVDEFTKMVFDSLEKSKTLRNVIDFDDMVLFPIIFDLKVDKFDYILIDEAQDLGVGLLQIALKAKKENSRIFVFADALQAIYQFRGAGGEQVIKMIDEIGGKKLPLPICYRCPTSVVDLARKYAPTIESFPGNKQGEVKNITYDEMYKIIPKGTFVISRYNAPLVPVYFSLLKLGKSAFIIGKDIGNNLITIIKRSKCKSIDNFKSKMDEMRRAEIAKAKKEKRSYDLIDDKYDCLENISATCKTVKELSDKINKMFTDIADHEKISLMSTHKAKGLEADTVILLKKTFSPDSDDQAERNIFYVAISRTKDKLYFVEKEKSTK